MALHKFQYRVFFRSARPQGIARTKRRKGEALMKAGKIWGWIDLVILACAVGWAQDTHSANDWGRSGVAIPRLVRFSGIVNDESGEPMHGVVGLTFALYRERDGGAPL